MLRKSMGIGVKYLDRATEEEASTFNHVYKYVCATNGQTVYTESVGKVLSREIEP